MILIGRCVRQCVRTARGRQENSANDYSDKENESERTDSQNEQVRPSA